MNKLMSILCLLVCLAACKFPHQTPIVGQVVTIDGRPVVNAAIEVYCIDNKGEVLNSRNGVTDKEGRFSMKGKLPPEGGKCVVNVGAEGYAPVSKVFYKGIPNYSFTLTPATIVPGDAGQNIVAVDNQARCFQMMDSASLTYANPSAKEVVGIAADGTIVDFGVPPSLRNAYANLFKRQCASGASVSIPRGALATNGNVQINITTVNLFNPDGMPGDFSARFGDETGLMASYGAMSVDVYQEGKKVGLKKGMYADLTIPIDSSKYNADEKPMDSIPFLAYEPKHGVWNQEGYARLSNDGKSYTKRVNHFSSFNLDMKITGGTCLQINGGSLSFDAAFRVTLIFEDRAPVEYTLQNVDDSPTNPTNGCRDTACNCRHFFFRLDNGRPIGILGRNSTGTSIIGNYVVYTPAAGTFGGTSIACADYGTVGNDSVERSCIPLVNPPFDPGHNAANVGLPMNASPDCNPAAGIQPCLIQTQAGVNKKLRWYHTFNDAVNNRIYILKREGSGSGYTATLFRNYTTSNVLDMFDLTGVNSTGTFKILAIENFCNNTCEPVVSVDNFCEQPVTCSGCAASGNYLCSNEVTVP